MLALYRVPAIGLVFVAFSLFTLWEVPNPPALVNLVGAQIYAVDLITLAMFVVSILRFRRVSDCLGKALFAWLGLGGLLVFSLLRGIDEFGLQASINEARAFIWVYLAASWAFSVDWSQLKFDRFSLFLGYCLIGVAVYHAAVYGLGNASSVVESGGLRQTGRLLVSTQALALALCAVPLLIGTLWQSRRFGRVSAWLMLIAVVISQHRSVWAGVGSGLLAVLLFSHSSHAKARVWLISALGALILLILWQAEAFQTITSDLFASATDSRTIEARTSSWVQLVDQSFAMGSFEVLFGQAFGSGYIRVEPNGLVTTYAPHNWYVSLFLRVGILGLALWLNVLISLTSRARRDSPSAFFVLIAISVFGWFYALPWQIMPWIGLASSRLGRPPDKSIVSRGSNQNRSAKDYLRADISGARNDFI